MARNPKAAAVPDGDDAAAHAVAEQILRLLSQVPVSKEPARSDPLAAARERANRAAIAAATAAGSLALPVGPAGWLTILPELMAVWRIQAHMVADIAAFFGKQGSLTREHMVYCLFRHAASQAIRDLVVRVGERAAARWLPIVGALGVAAYAYYDTGQVAKSAMDLFQRELAEGPESDTPGPGPT